MQATGARLLRALATRIHNHPLPLSKKESQQLLSMLSESFEQHLTRSQSEHITARTKSLSGYRTGTQPLKLEQSYRSRPTTLNTSSKVSTAEHLLGILQHPLFTTKAKVQDLQLENLHAHHIRSLEHGVDWLEGRFAHGRASKLDILQFLNYYYKEARRNTEYDQGRRLPGLKVSLKLEAWLKPGNVMTVEELHTSKATKTRWSTLLVLEGRADALRAAILASEDAKFRNIVLASYVTAELRYGRGLQFAVRELLDLKQAIPALSIFHASRQIFIRLPSGSKDLPAPLYDEFVALLQSGQYLTSHQFDKAVLDLFHPTTSTTRTAFEYLTSLTSDEIKENTKIRAQRTLMLSMCLKLAHQLIEKQKLAEAQKILLFTQSHFPEELGGASNQHGLRSSQLGKRSGNSTEEREYVEVLDALLAT